MVPQHEQDNIRLEIQACLKVGVVPVGIVGCFLHGVAAGSVVFDLVMISKKTLESGRIGVFGDVGDPGAVSNAVPYTGDTDHLAPLAAKAKKNSQGAEEQGRKEESQFCFEFHISTSFGYHLEHINIIRTF